MRVVLIVHLAGLLACGSHDRAAPTLVGAWVLPDTPVAPAEPSSPLVAPTPRVGTMPTVDLEFSEHLDGDAIEGVATDPSTGAVLGFHGRDGVVRVAPIDGSVVGESIGYIPARRSIRVCPTVHLPAATTVLIHVMADRVWDADGNVLEVARYPDGEPVRDIDGRGIAATIALTTEPVEILGATIPAYGTPDDPDTEIDEGVPYDAGILLELNTAVDPASVVATLLAAGSTPALVAGAGAEPTVVQLRPVAPLDAGTAYELRVDAAADRFGIPWLGAPRHFPFATR